MATSKRPKARIGKKAKPARPTLRAATGRPAAAQRRSSKPAPAKEVSPYDLIDALPSAPVPNVTVRTSKTATVSSPNCVTIFGGGVAGLSAAHELVERGFRVQVWEPNIDERDPEGGCDLGGMARTQWGAVPWKETRDTGVRGDEEANDGPFGKESQTRHIRHLPWAMYLAGEKIDAVVDDAGIVQETTAIKEALRRILGKIYEEFADEKAVIYCEVQRRVPDLTTGHDRAHAVVKLINENIEGSLKLLWLDETDPEYGDLRTTVLVTPEQAEFDESKPHVKFPVAFLDGFPDGMPDGVDGRITLRLRERWLPGEHGFRVFPAFYYHLFDTMKRTPILEPVEKSPVGAAQERSVTVNANKDKYVETGRTVYDNLQPTTSQVFAPGTGVPRVFSRSMPTSFEEIRDWLHFLLKKQGHDSEDGGLGLTARDLARAQLKFLQYLTSCEERREMYEEMSWLEFLGGEKAYSSTFVKVINQWPRALVAMDGRTSDARTQGSAYTQLMLDNLKPPGYRDGTLVGPTSVAWLKPWRRYLEAQGVEFIHGRLTGFRRAVNSQDQPVIWPKVECYEPRYPGALKGDPLLMPGYFLLALPALELCTLAEQFRAAAKGTHIKVGESDIVKTEELFAKEHRDARESEPRSTYPATFVDSASPEGQLRHMVGVQYYFDEDIDWRDGHYYLPLSPWGLTAISQVRYWQDRHDWEHGYRGILSVVFTVTDEKTNATANAKTAWESTPREIAQSVWAQIKTALDYHPADRSGRNAAGISLPEPKYWHLDFGLEPDGKGYRNWSPLLVSVPGKWKQRPGELEPINPNVAQKRNSFGKYTLTAGYVCAGTHMKTYTRLTTMEAANESARHAVNAILKDALGDGYSTPCTIWPIEEREPRDFGFLRELDQRLCDKGLDHFIEILDAEELIGRALSGTKQNVVDPLDPFAVLTELAKAIKQNGGDVFPLKYERTNP